MRRYATVVDMAGTRCTTCNHPDVVSINGALLTGSSQRAVARAYGLAPTSVRRHVNDRHVPELLTDVAAHVEAVTGDQLLAENVTLYERALALLTEAEHDDDRKTRVRALAEVRRCLELLARMTVASAGIEGLSTGERPDLDAAIAARLGVHHPDVPHQEGAEGEAAHTQHVPLALLPGPELRAT